MEDNSRELKEDHESPKVDDKQVKPSTEHQSPASTSQVHIRKPMMQERIIPQSENKDEQDYSNIRFASSPAAGNDLHPDASGKARG